MKLTHIISASFVMLVCVVLAQAQSDRTFVSAHGTDNSDCGSSDLPCRSFGFALAKTNAAGTAFRAAFSSAPTPESSKYQSTTAVCRTTACSRVTTASM